jgi:hypothetical protein
VPASMSFTFASIAHFILANEVNGRSSYADLSSPPLSTWQARVWLHRGLSKSGQIVSDRSDPVRDSRFRCVTRHDLKIARLSITKKYCSASDA